MHRKSQTQRKNASQKSQDKSRQSRASQSLIESSQSQGRTENEEELVHNCARYFLYKAGSGVPIRKTDIQKFILKNTGRNFVSILNKVKETLSEVYGYDLYECNDGLSAVRYLISNSLSHNTSNELAINQQCSTDENSELPEDANKILVMIILTHIFMSNESVTQSLLFSFLQLLQIDPELNHQTFGNVKSFITTTMIHQKYLIQETDEITRNIIYKWGPRAEHEISKHDLLKFVCNIYKDRNPKSWTKQYEIASAQFNDHSEQQNGNEAMDVN